MAKKVFIFGGSGFIGVNLSKALSERQIEAVSVGRSESNDVCFDLENPSWEVLEDLVEEGDRVVFLAAVSSPEFCSTNYDKAYQVNVQNTILVIRHLLLLHVRVLFASSDVVYGRTERPVDESSEIKPTFEYAQMKAAVEAAFCDDDGFYVMRLSYVWSVDDKFTKFIEASSTSKSLVEVFHPLIRSIISLEDVISFILIFVSERSVIPKLVNLAGPEFVTRVQLVGYLREYIDVEYYVATPSQQFLIYRPDQILMTSMSLQTVLGRPPVTISRAIGKAFKNDRAT